MNGSIFLPRSELLHNYLDIYNDKYKMWWWQIIAMAAWRDIKIDKRTILRGQVYTSMRYLASLFLCEEPTVTRFLNIIESLNMITRESDRHGTMITIAFYDRYQPTGERNSIEEPTGRDVNVVDKVTHKMPQYEEKKKSNNSKKKRREEEARLSFDEEEKIYERLKIDDEFWTNMKDSLEAPIEELKVYFEKFRKSMLVKQRLHKSETDLREHIHDYAKKILESNAVKQQQQQQQTNGKNQSKTADYPGCYRNKDYTRTDLDTF